MTRPRPVPPPDDLPEPGKDLWRATQRALRRQGTWQDSDAQLLELYVRAVVTYRTATETAAREPFTRGSRGQTVAHPALRLQRDSGADVARYGDALLLTPAARKRAGLAASKSTDDLAVILNGA